MRWRRKTVRGFGLTNAAAAAAAVLAVVTSRAGRDGDPAPAVAAWAVATAIAIGLAVWAFRVEAERVFGPPGSPERRRRRLSPAQLVRSLGAGVLAAGAFGLILVLLSIVDDSFPSAGRLPLIVLYLAPVYGAADAWSTWAAEDDDEAGPEVEGIPARSVPRPAAPPRDREKDLRRGFVVCVLLGLLGVLGAVEGFVNGDWQSAGVGLALAAGSAGLILWVGAREGWP
jgi:hypothetical protein